MESIGSTFFSAITAKKVGLIPSTTKEAGAPGILRLSLPSPSVPCLAPTSLVGPSCPPVTLVALHACTYSTDGSGICTGRESPFWALFLDQ